MIVSGSPESFGWQRVPDYDTQISVCYELPDGTLKKFRRDEKRIVMRLCYAEQKRNAEVEERHAPFGFEKRASGDKPKAGDSDHAIGEAG